MEQSLDFPYIVDNEEAFIHLPLAVGQKLVRWAYLHRVLRLVPLPELYFDVPEGSLLQEIIELCQ